MYVTLRVGRRVAARRHPLPASADGQPMSSHYIAQVLITHEQIQSRIAEIAADIERDHPGGDPIHLICVLKGGFLFLSDLVRAMSNRVSLDFIAVSSYGKGTSSSGEVRLLKDLDAGHRGPRRRRSSRTSSTRA